MIGCSVQLSFNTARCKDLGVVGCSFKLTAGAYIQREVYDGTIMPKHVLCMRTPAKLFGGECSCHGSCYVCDNYKLNIFLSNRKCHQAAINPWMACRRWSPFSVLRNQLALQWSGLGHAHCNLESTPTFLTSVICYLEQGSSGGVPPGGGLAKDPESRRESGCGLDEASCGFSGIGHGLIFWELQARTMHAQGCNI